jgi:hypothetical protein
MSEKEESTDRRDFLQTGLLGTAGMGLAVASTASVTMAEGDAAALAANSGTTPLDVPLADIHAVLREHGQIIPGKS